MTIVESLRVANFLDAGYGFFANYDPRVFVDSTVDWPKVLVPVPGGRTYEQLILPAALVDPDIVFVSAAKLKLHVQAHVTLTMKNLFGVPPAAEYFDERHPTGGRYGMHARSVSQTVVDLNLARPIHFAVIDGIIGMEGRGPGQGDPVRMDVVLAGLNPLAVDRVGTEVMGVDPRTVLHLLLATAASLGPADLGDIVLAGDTLPTRAFRSRAGSRRWSLLRLRRSWKPEGAPPRRSGSGSTNGQRSRWRMPRSKTMSRGTSPTSRRCRP